jgi:hypothetical protein
MNLMTAGELFDSIGPAPSEPVLDIDAATDIVIETGQVYLRPADGLPECASSLDGIGRAVKRVQMSGGSETFSEAYEAEGQLSHSILVELHEAIVSKRENQQA